MRYTSLCAIAKDEDHALTEWADYHLRLGFEHIYVFDNASRTPVREVLAESVALGLVTVIDLPLTKNQQLSAYAGALREFGETTVWMGFIDLDEFVVPKTCTDIRDVLDTYTAYGGLAANWSVFGSNGHRRRPEASVISSYTNVVGRDVHIKSIVRPKAVASVASPHHFLYQLGCWCVNEDAVPVTGAHSYHAARTIQINHYYYKSFEDFVAKNKRGLATQASDGRTWRNADEFDDFARNATAPGTYDDAALRLVRSWSAHGPLSLPVFLQDVKTVLLSGPTTGFAEFSKLAAERLAACDTAGALAALRSCLRYHDTPPAWMMAAKLYLALRDQARSLHFISRMLHELDAPYRGEAYQCLAEYYRKFGEPEKADSIQAELQAGKYPDPRSCS